MKVNISRGFRNRMIKLQINKKCNAIFYSLVWGQTQRKPGCSAFSLKFHTLNEGII